MWSLYGAVGSVWVSQSQGREFDHHSRHFSELHLLDSFLVYRILFPGYFCFTIEHDDGLMWSLDDAVGSACVRSSFEAFFWVTSFRLAPGLRYSFSWIFLFYYWTWSRADMEPRWRSRERVSLIISSSWVRSSLEALAWVMHSFLVAGNLQYSLPSIFLLF